MHINRLICFLSLLLLFTTCKKDKDPGVSSPQHKRNHIYAKINGNNWEACDDAYGFNGPVVTTQYFTGQYFDMTGLDVCDPNGSELYIKVLGLVGTGSYQLGGNTSNIGFFSGMYFNADGTNKPFQTDSLHTGSVTVTEFDLQKKKISGSFQFSAYNADTNIVIHVTEGRFNKVDLYIY